MGICAFSKTFVRGVLLDVLGRRLDLDDVGAELAAICAA